MNWFYQKNDKEIGPLSEATLRELHGCGILSDESAVRAEDSNDWLSYSEAVGQYSDPLGEQVTAPGKADEIKFACPHCQQSISASSTDSGLATKCPTCAGDIVVPSAEGASLEPTGSLHPEGLGIGHAEAGNTHAHEPANAPGIAASSLSAADRIKTGAKAGWAGVKRNSKIAVLHAQIEKLKNVDLRKAHHSLGKRCYELGLMEEPLASSFETIREIEARIAADRKSEQAPEEDKRSAALVRMTRQAAKATHAQALNLKLQHLLTELGRLAYPRREQGNLPGLEVEVERIGVIECQIFGTEQEVESIGGKPTKAGRSKAVIVAAALIVIVTAGSILALRLLSNGKNDSSIVSDNRETSQAKIELNQAEFHYMLQEYKEAAKLYLKAAAKGEPRAQYVLGRIYLLGEGVDEDHKEAYIWFSQAASQGNHEAQAMMGTYHKAKSNKILGYMWLNLAASSDDTKTAGASRKERQELASTMSWEEIKEAQKMCKDWKPNQLNQPGLFSRAGTERPKDATTSGGSKYPNRMSSSSSSSLDQFLRSRYPAQGDLRNRLEDGLRAVQDCYSSLTAEEALRILEDISGKPLTNANDAYQAARTIERFRDTAIYTGRSPSKLIETAIESQKRIRNKMQESHRVLAPSFANEVTIDAAMQAKQNQDTNESAKTAGMTLPSLPTFEQILRLKEDSRIENIERFEAIAMLFGGKKRLSPAGQTKAEQIIQAFNKATDLSVMDSLEIEAKALLVLEQKNGQFD